MYNSRATFKETLQQVVCFSK